METTTGLPDEQLLNRVSEGDDDSFAELVKRYQEKIFTLCYRYVPHADEAEDVTAEIFFRVWKHADAFRGTAAFSTWLYRITVNCCLTHKKKKHAIPFLESLDEPVVTDEGAMTKEAAEHPRGQPEQAVLSGEQDALVRQAVEALPPQQRMALVLSWYESRSYQEIASLMNVSRSSVESLLFRAKENLRKSLAHLKK